MTTTADTTPSTTIPQTRQPMKSPSRFAMLRGTLLRDVGLPIASYYLLKELAGVPDVYALTAGGVISGGIAVFGIIRSRKIDAVAIFILGMFALGVAAALVTGDARFVLAKDSAITFLVGVVFLGSTLAAKPLLYHFAARTVRGTPRGRELETAYASYPILRGKFRKASVMWGVGLIVEAVVRLVLVYSLPVSVMAAGSTVLMVVTMGILFLITMRYLRPRG